MVRIFIHLNNVPLISSFLRIFKTKFGSSLQKKWAYFLKNEFIKDASVLQAKE